MSKQKRLIVGISGATGAVYGVRMLEILAKIEDIETHLVLTKAGKMTIQVETPYSVKDVEAMADVTFEPGRTGHVAVTIRVLREDFSPFPAKAVRLVLRPPAGGEAFDRPALEGEQGTWTIDHVELSTGGVWAIQVVVTAQSGKSIVLDGPIVIDR